MQAVTLRSGFGLKELLGCKREFMTYIPIYHRSPNRFVRYEMHRFDDGAGNTGTARVAFYLDKHGIEKQETAQVIWDRQPHSRISNA